MVPADSRGISPVPPYSGSHCGRTRFPYVAVTRYGPPSHAVPVPVAPASVALLPRARLNARGLGCSPFARHYLGNHSCFLLLPLLRCFSSRRSLTALGGVPPEGGGLPHSDIHGSTLRCNSPWLFAALHVLLRLLVPRHPPCALTNFPF
jgi:hypothetical protein